MAPQLPAGPPSPIAREFKACLRWDKGLGQPLELTVLSDEFRIKIRHTSPRRSHHSKVVFTPNFQVSVVEMCFPFPHESSSRSGFRIPADATLGACFDAYDRYYEFKGIPSGGTSSASGERGVREAGYGQGCEKV